MASLVTVARYRVITLDTTSADAAVTAALDTAEDIVEEYLRRPLPAVERTETVRFSGDGRLYPAATPISAVAGGLTIQVGGVAIYGGTPDGGPFFPSFTDSTYPPAATITYTGGYSADTLPRTIERQIAWLAHQALHVAALASLPTGATSASVGDVSVSFDGSAGAGASLSEVAEDELRPYRRRFI